jgi:hypothetical protein
MTGTDYAAARASPPISPRSAAGAATALFVVAAASLAWFERQVWQLAPAPAAGPIDPRIGIELYWPGLFAALVVPLFWAFFSGALHAVTGRPGGRWIALGWSVLTLASAAPLVWHYRQTAEPTFVLRLFEVGIGLSATIGVASLMPRPFRNAMGAGLIPAFVVVPGLGGIAAAIVEEFPDALSRIGLGPFDGIAIFTRSLEYALPIGIGLGLLFGVAASRGWMTIVSSAASSSGGGVE